MNIKKKCLQEKLTREKYSELEKQHLNKCESVKTLEKEIYLTRVSFFYVLFKIESVSWVRILIYGYINYK